MSINKYIESINFHWLWSSSDYQLQDRVNEIIDKTNLNDFRDTVKNEQ